MRLDFIIVCTVMALAISVGFAFANTLTVIPL